MKHKRTYLIAALLGLLAAIGTTTVVTASSEETDTTRTVAEAFGADDDAGEADDDANEADERVTDRRAADRAREAALGAVRGGTVTEVELADEGDEGYEVEVRRPDGSFVEVALDPGFKVVEVEEDDD